MFPQKSESNGNFAHQHSLVGVLAKNTVNVLTKNPGASVSLLNNIINVLTNTQVNVSTKNPWALVAVLTNIPPSLVSVLTSTAADVPIKTTDGQTHRRTDGRKD